MNLGPGNAGVRGEISRPLDSTILVDEVVEEDVQFFHPLLLGQESNVGLNCLLVVICDFGNGRRASCAWCVNISRSTEAPQVNRMTYPAFRWSEQCCRQGRRSEWTTCQRQLLQIGQTLPSYSRLELYLPPQTAIIVVGAPWVFKLNIVESVHIPVSPEVVRLPCDFAQPHVLAHLAAEFEPLQVLVDHFHVAETSLERVLGRIVDLVGRRVLVESVRRSAEVSRRPCASSTLRTSRSW